MAGQSEAMMVGSKGSVSLDARFDAGYFCTVRVGKHEFKGPPARFLLNPYVPMLVNVDAPN